MSLARALSSFALDQLVDGACKAVGVPGVDAVAGFLKRHFTEHDAKLDKALRAANERAWKALELALEGESFWGRCSGMLVQADQKAFATQIRTFLERCPLAMLKGQRDEVRAACLRDLRAARKARLLDPTADAPDFNALVNAAAPQARVREGMRELSGMATALKDAGFPYLAWLVGIRPADSAPLLVLAVRFFFRLEVSGDPELSRSLEWASWEQLAEDQARGFASLRAALVQNGNRLEQMFAGTHRVVLSIEAEVRGQRQQIAGVAQMVQDLLDQHRLANRELRPQDSFSIRNDADRDRIKQLVGRFRGLPPEEQGRLPALLNGIGKLQHAAGDFAAAQATFARVAAVSPEADAQAEASHNAYLAAVEKRDWQEALAAIQRATELNPARFQLFQAEKYEPMQIVGAGGFGVAILCRHRHTGGLRVLKTLRSDSLTEQTVQRIVQEAKALEGVRHEAIISLHDCEYADVGKSRLYLVMEYFDGTTLAEHVRQHGPLTQKEALDLGRRIGEGLRVAHDHRVLHRDIKPGNILVKKDGDTWKVKIIDFGLARRESLSDAAVTVAGAASGTAVDELAGTFDYAAPEQIGKLPGVSVDKRADIFGFGRTCCFALYGSPVPTGAQWRAMPKALAHWLDACMAERPDGRPKDFAAVLQMLEKVRLRRPAADKPDPVALPALVVCRGQRPGAEYLLQEGRNVLGREGADIDIEDQGQSMISREHCAITLKAGQLSIEDLASTNGTYLNRARLRPGESANLKTGDMIQIGVVILRVRE